MAKSFLFKGRDTEQLSPIERQLEALFDRIDRPDRRLTPEQFFASPEFQQFTTTQFGAIPVPPGARVLSQTPTEVRFLDAEGFEHVLQRDVSQGGGFGGQVIERTNRPPVLPDQRAQGFLNTLQSSLQQGLTGPLPLAALDSETAAALQAIRDAEVARNQQQFQDQSGDLLARLFGQGVQRSSIATESAGRLAQLQGLVTQQQQADAAARELQLRQFLTNLRQQQTGLSADLFANLTGQGTQRDIASAGLNVDLRRLEEQARQFNRGFNLESLRTQEEIEKRQAATSPLNKLLTISQIAANLTGAAGGALGGISALRGLTGGVPAPNLGAGFQFPSTQTFGNLPANPRVPGF